MAVVVLQVVGVLLALLVALERPIGPDLAPLTGLQVGGFVVTGGEEVEIMQEAFNQAPAQ